MTSPSSSLFVRMIRWLDEFSEIFMRAQYLASRWENASALEIEALRRESGAAFGINTNMHGAADTLTPRVDADAEKIFAQGRAA